MLKTVQYLAHQLTAKNHHGVHSPFVYGFLTQCLYKKPAVKQPKSTQVLLKCIPYFNIRTARLVTSNNGNVLPYITHKGIVIDSDPPYDLVYFEDPSLISSDLVKAMHNNTLFFVDEIHENKHNSEIWHQLITDPIFTVSIDLFCCGLLFFRREQEKEHFKLRLETRNFRLEI